MIDWNLAERIGGAIAGNAEAAEWWRGVNVTASATRACEALVELTGLEPAGEIPAAESVGRKEWLEANVHGLRDSLRPIETGIEGELELPGVLGGLARSVVGGAIGAEAGAILGYAAGRVLGQYEIALVGPPRPPRLLFVAPNITAAAGELGSQQALLDWIALHEVTHALQFGSTPWLRTHLGGLVEQLMAGIEPRGTAARLMDAGRTAMRTDPRKLLGEMREVGPVGALLGPEQTTILGRLQGAMSAIEGYAEYAMDAAGAEAELGVTRLRAAMERRRQARSPLESLLARILGMELKLRQYRDGRRFADAVVAAGGIKALNLLYSEPSALPDASELSNPDEWLRRVST